MKEYEIYVPVLCMQCMSFKQQLTCICVFVTINMCRVNKTEPYTVFNYSL